jgi:threonine/homoserine/homoserine lactone efflux protein
MLPTFDPSALLTYALAAAALVIAPGPGQALVLTRTLQGGTRDGVLTALGLEIGTLIHIAAAALGLSAVLTTSATAFNVVKYVGAGYLVLLGVSALRRAGVREAASGATAVAAAGGPRLLFHAAVTGTLNPKVALFFLAFLPQFVDPRRGGVLGQFLVLGLIFAALGLLGDSLLAVAVGRARHRVLDTPLWTRWRERFTGLVLMGLGIRLAFLRR